MPNSFAESADGVVLIANGIDPVVRWDGFAAVAEEAGVEAPDPDVIPALSGSGTGNINGTYACYVRFLDERGQPGNLSSSSAEVVITNAGQVNYTNLPVPADGKSVTRQILRNTAGQMATFYVDVEDSLVSSTTATGTRTDATLATQEAVVLIDPETGLATGNRYGRPPATKPFLAYHLGRMWASGEQPYSEGSVKVTQGSTTVTGVATDWPQTWNDEGRFLYVKGASRSYEIDAIDAATQTITLVEAYEDATDAFAEYSVKPSPGEASLIYFSEPGLPEAWPLYNALSIPEDNDQVTGMLQFGSFLWVFKRRRTYRVSAQSNPLTDGFIFFALNRGAINHRCFVIVDEMIYSLDEGGIYRTGGGDQAEQLSTPIQDLFRANSGAINWAASRYFHAVYSPSEEVIRWFVTLRGDYLPRHALALSYRTGKWWIEDWPLSVGCSVVGRAGRPTGSWANQTETVFLGGPAGEYLAVGGPLDGAEVQGGTTRGRVSSAGIDSLTAAGATFDTSTENVPVCIYSGRGAGQRRTVVSATATTLKVDEPWAVKPDTTSLFQLGGIPFKYTSGRMRYAPTEREGGRSAEVQFVPTAGDQRFALRLLQDFSATPRKIGRNLGAGQRPGVTAAEGGKEYEVKLNDASGHFWQRYDGHREQSVAAPRLFQLQLEGVSGPEPVLFGEVVLNGAVR